MLGQTGRKSLRFKQVGREREGKRDADRKSKNREQEQLLPALKVQGLPFININHSPLVHG